MKKTCFSSEMHIAELHENLALVSDYLNIGFYTNHSKRYLISTVEGSVVAGCETKYCVMLWDKFTGEKLNEEHVNLVSDILRCGIQMVRDKVHAEKKAA